MISLYPAALSAAPVVLPGSADTGRVLRPVVPARPAMIPQPLITIPKQQSEAPPGAEKTAFILKQVVLKGVTAYDPKTLEHMFASYVGKQVTVGTVYRFAAMVGNRYHQDGYALSEAVIPPQKITDGTVTIRVIEGYINQVNTQGSYRASSVTKAILARYPAGATRSICMRWNGISSC